MKISETELRVVHHARNHTVPFLDCPLCAETRESCLLMVDYEEHVAEIADELREHAKELRGSDEICPIADDIIACADELTASMRSANE